MESETGKSTELPYDVDNDFAMKQPEVVKRITASNKSLIAAADKFLNHFIKNMDKIPYGMRYTAKVLKESLHEKFPDAQEGDILKVCRCADGHEMTILTLQRLQCKSFSLTQKLMM